MRKAGILMHISSLPSPYGIGTLGAEAERFADFLAAGGQSCWQLLPVGPASYGDSPYQSFSSFAGNPYFIDLDRLAEDGLLEPEEYRELDWGDDASQVDYGLMYQTRFPVLRKAYDRLLAQDRPDFAEFCGEQRDWLEDYALFMALKDKYEGASWFQWPEGLRLRRADALEKARKELAGEAGFWKGVQYFFFRQWRRFKNYVNSRGVSLIGDLPIYVAGDSADVWANPEQFQLDEDGLPTEVAGCPPDAFTEDGQLWGNPLFDWERMKEDGYAWWLRRIAFQFQLFDTLRIDHFRGFESYYAIPYGDKTARNGRWRPGPGIAFFQAVNKALGKRDIIAEDLGFLTPAVHKLLKDSGYPGMKILEFAFDSRDVDSDYLPHRYPPHCVVYAGTHDNDTIQGWLASAPKKTAAFAKAYMRLSKREGRHWGVMRTAWASPAELAVMQFQDLLGLGSEARMNTPSTLGNNWKWRALPGSFKKKLAKQLYREMRVYQRLPKTETKSNTPKVRRNIDMQLNEQLTQLTQDRFGRTPDQCSDGQLYEALLLLTRRLAQDRPAPAGERKLYYFSAEFLMGKLLSNNLLALGLYQEVRKLLAGMGRDLGVIESMEPEPSLGNGGLGRLAACFLDSIAALGLPGDGVGLNYHYGLFKQKFDHGRQTEVPDPWIQPDSWLIPTGMSFDVPFGGFDLKAVLYDIAIPGANNEYANRLHLFDVEKPAGAPWVGIDFDKGDIAHRLTSFLYPDDSDEAGRLLRVYQQYFMVSAGAQLILSELEARGYALSTLADHVVVQINDTHPSMVIPELIRLLTERGMSFDDALDQVSRTCAYTNHTILAEALEKWPLSFIEKVAPKLVPIILELDRRMKKLHPDPKVAIVDDKKLVHMAHMDIHCGFSVNGVAYLHTEILKNSELKPFYDLYPEKFNNKTNGVTFRRWLEVCDPELTALIDNCIGTDWRQDAKKLEKLLDFQEDADVLDQLLDVKQHNKNQLCREIWIAQSIELDPHSVFDIQVKRLHEYKRQQMNALYLIHKYLEIKSGKLPERPVTLLFGAKAAPAYIMAKRIIHLILCLQKLIEQDPQVRPWLRVAMVENYNVTWAERLIPACDISEQISLASKEASGTGNMKFMANGAVTLGTLDGANVEIAQLVGEENIYTFGERSDTVIKLYKGGEPDGRAYRPLDYYHRPAVEPLVDFLVSPALLAIGDPTELSELWRDMKNKDWFMALLDVEDYIAAKDKAVKDYGDRRAWAKKMLVNIAKSGFFSSDRTIQQYNEDIWKLK